MNRAVEAVAGGVVVTGLAFTLGGCVVAAPPLEAPNGKIGPVENNLNYAATLDRLTLLQPAVRVVLPPVPGESYRQHVDVWNYTDARVSPSAIGAVANYLAGVGDSAQNRSVAVRYNDGITKESFSLPATVVSNDAKEHDVVLVPAGELPPPGPAFESGNSTTLFLNRMKPGEPQTISVVYQEDASNSDLSPVLGLNRGIFTELCQAEVVGYDNTDGLNSSIDPSVLQEITQETVCNEEGLLLRAALGNMSYKAYKALIHRYQGMKVYDIDGSWSLYPTAVSAKRYARIRQQFQSALAH